MALLLLLTPLSDFIYPAGNWTHLTNLFSEVHYLPGYNADGEWTVLTGGNWTPTNHSDVNLIGDAAVYICPCPQPPCGEPPLPPSPGYNSSVFPCLDSESGNVSHAVCTVFYRDKSNVTCLTPNHAVICEIPALDVNATLGQWWNNEELPSRSFYWNNVTAVSCLIRDDVGESAFPPELLNFTDAMALQDALAVVVCEVQCRAVCETVCTTNHRSVHELAPHMSAWVFDREIDNNPREFVMNGTLYSENHPAQYLRGNAPSTYGRQREPDNVTCTMPTMTETRHRLIFGGSSSNLTASQGLLDMYGRRFHAMNVFDLTLYVALHVLRPLEGLQCVTPFPGALGLGVQPGLGEPYQHALVCHEPRFEPYNVSIGPAPVGASGGAGGASGAGAGRRQLERQLERDAEEAEQDAREMEQQQQADANTTHDVLDTASWDSMHWDPNGQGSDWDWQHALAIRQARNASHWARRWRTARRPPPRGRQLYHEFEIDRSEWDFWLAEDATEHHARLVRQHAQLTGDCRFYHNCSDPLPPPLLLHEFSCWWANVYLQPNVSILPPRSLAARPTLHAVNANTTFDRHTVSCVQPSWPNSTSISCLSPTTAITCPYTDAYRGNATELLAAGEEYSNETTNRCTAWPLLDVYRHAADTGYLFPLPSNGSDGYVDPWERPFDSCPSADLEPQTSGAASGLLLLTRLSGYHLELTSRSPGAHPILRSSLKILLAAHPIDRRSSEIDSFLRRRVLGGGRAPLLRHRRGTGPALHRAQWRRALFALLA